MLSIFAVALLALLSVLFEYIYHDVSFAVITSVRDSILNDSGTASSISLDDIRTQNLTTVVLVTAAVTLAFGYLLTRVALSPTRTALASQKQFVGNIAHELRTPLSIIKTNTEVALLGDNVPGDMRGILTSTVEELDRLSEIINNLLSLSASIRPEKIEFSPVDASVIAEEVVNKLGGLARTKNLDITLKKSDWCFVWGNTAAMEQILVNVIKNAINHTGKGGHISVTVEQIGTSHIEIVVQDSGEGISRQDLFHIFEPFYRAEPSRNRIRGGGSGLGLAIVSELVKLHRGKITVRSAINRGTSVVISLPIAPAPRSDAAIRAKRSFDEVAVDFSHRRI